jgi:hypothetical protein
MGGLDLVVTNSTARSRRSATRTSSSPRWSSPTTTGSTAATWRSTRGAVDAGAQAPVASDLRIVAALLHIIRCVERMGDQCVNIAKLVPLSGYEAPKDKDILDLMERMGNALASRCAGQARRSARATCRWPRTWSARTPLVNR